MKLLTSPALRVDAIIKRLGAGFGPIPLSGERRIAIRDALAAFFSSRLLIWIAGIATVLLVGRFPHNAVRLDPAHLTMPFQHELGDLLISPASRWDSGWYLGIAKTGYVFSVQSVFFPLYPGLIAIGGAAVGKGFEVLVGIGLSCASAIGALYLLHRLVSLDFDQRLARNTVWIFAWLPIALVLSAVYSEALFMLFTLGSIFAGRLGRWRWAGLLGGLAAATRNTGLLLVVPLLILYFYGPRTDRRPDRTPDRLTPRYSIRRDLLWVGLVPVGLIGYLVFLNFAIGHPLAPFTHQHHWGRSFLPLSGVPLGIWTALRDLGVLVFPGLDPGLPLKFSGVIRHLVYVAFLVLSLCLLRLSWKRLPGAYTAFAAVGLALAVSVPAKNDALKSFPRFTLVLFPLWIALALWATERRLVRMVVGISAPLLAAAAYLFVSWRWTP